MKIILEYKNHPIILKIKETFKNFENYDLPKTSPAGINKVINLLNSKEATFPEQAKIPRLAVLDRYIKTKGKNSKTLDPSQFYHISQKLVKKLF